MMGASLRKVLKGAACSHHCACAPLAGPGRTRRPHAAAPLCTHTHNMHAPYPTCTPACRQVPHARPVCVGPRRHRVGARAPRVPPGRGRPGPGPAHGCGRLLPREAGPRGGVCGRGGGGTSSPRDCCPPQKRARARAGRRPAQPQDTHPPFAHTLAQIHTHHTQPTNAHKYTTMHTHTHKCTHPPGPQRGRRAVPRPLRGLGGPRPRARGGHHARLWRRL